MQKEERTRRHNPNKLPKWPGRSRLSCGLAFLWTVGLQFPVERIADDCADCDDRPQDEHFLRIWFHESVNDVGCDEKFEAEEQVITKDVAELPAFVVDRPPASGRNFSADESDQPRQNPENDHKDT